MCQAIHSRSGLGLLFTVDKAMFLRAKPTEAADKNGTRNFVSVNVSRLYHCDDEENLPIFPALVEFCRQALSEVEKSGAVEESRECVQIVGAPKSLNTETSKGGSGSSRRRDEDNSDGLPAGLTAIGDTEEERVARRVVETTRGDMERALRAAARGIVEQVARGRARRRTEWEARLMTSGPIGGVTRSAVGNRNGRVIHSS